VHDLPAFFGIALLVICVPGQDTALTVRNTLIVGRRNGFATAIGVTSGQAVWTVATSAGLAALLIASAPIFEVIRLAGAAYLIYLGLHALRSALLRAEGYETTGSRPTADQRPARISFRQGALSNLGNPKMAVFFTSLLPQFVPATGPTFLPLLILGLTFNLMTLAWLLGYVVAVARAGHFLGRPAIRRLTDAVVGIVLTAFGFRLATERT
jgi:threonine/homoserine/homoserine lactone efflux protein